MAMARSVVTTFALVAGLTIVTVGGAGVAAAQDAINLGIVLPQTGQNGDYVRRYLNAPTVLAVKQANEKGGLLGKKLNLIIEDSKYDPATATSAFRKLADVDKVLAVFTGFTPLTMPQLPIAEEKKVLVMAPSTEHPDLTKSPWAVRMTATADKAGVKVGQTASEMGFKTAAMISEDNESVRLTIRAFAAEFEKRGGKVVASETFKTQDNEMRGQLTKLRAANPDVLYIVASSGRPMALVVRQLNEVGLKPKQTFANHLMEDREVRALGPNLIDGVIYTTLEVKPEFSKQFEAEFGYPADANAGKHYDVTVLLFESIKKAGTLDPVKVRDTLYNYGKFDGVLGTFTFSGSGEPNVLPILKTIKNGEYIRHGT